MNILAIAAHGLYKDYSSSFVHNQLKAYVRLGHRVRAVVLVAAGKKTSELNRVGPVIEPMLQDGVEIFYLRYLSLGHFGENSFNPASAELAVKLMAKRLLRDFQPDIIHAHAILFAGRLAVALKKCCGAPVVITTHGGDTRLSAKAQHKDRAKRICDKAEFVGAVSEICADIVRNLGSDTPSVCILNGFEAKNVISRPKRKYSLVQANALRPDKHTELSIHAVDILRRKYPDISLNIVGDGTERNKLERLVAERGLTDFVHFHGRLSNPETLNVMARSEIFLMPSVREGFGIVYLEAMASDCVTIGTEGEGIDGFIRSGENGFLVPPMDVEGIVKVIEFCFENPQQARLIAEKGRQDALALTWESNAKKYLALFDEIIKTKEENA